MADSSYRVLRQLLSLLAKEENSKRKSPKDSDQSGDGYGAGAKEVFSNLAGLAGKGKDELIQILCREIGQATASVLKEPLAQLLKDKKLQLTIEFVPVKNDEKKSSGSKKSEKTKARGEAKTPAANTRRR